MQIRRLFEEIKKRWLFTIKGLVCESEWKNCKEKVNKKEIIINHGIARTNQVQERPLVFNKEKLSFLSLTNFKKNIF